MDNNSNLNHFRKFLENTLLEITSLRFWLEVFCEFFATFLLIFIGCLAHIQWSPDYKPTIIHTSLTFGLMVMTLILIFGHISGCFINPALTMAMLVARQISILKALLFMVGQILGSMAGACLLTCFVPVEYRGFMGAIRMNNIITANQGVFVEGIIAFANMLTFFATCDPLRKELKGVGAFVNGLCVTLCVLSAGYYSGSTISPVRSFGPAFAIGYWDNQWIYWVGPMVGGILAALLYELFLDCRVSKEKIRQFFTLGYNPKHFSYKKIDSPYEEDTNENSNKESAYSNDQRENIMLHRIDSSTHII